MLLMEYLGFIKKKVAEDYFLGLVLPRVEQFL